MSDDHNAPEALSPHEQAELNQAVESAAAALVQRYGDDAEVIATLRAAEFAANGDTEALHAWDLIIAYLVSLREGPTGNPSATIN